MYDTIRWGILGTGGIARKFATGLQALDDAALVAVGSRSAETADRFADQFGAPRRHASYAALAADPEVDAIYVATPHSLHQENSLLCLEAGKPVLVEKPFTINAQEARALIDAARARRVFLMEAMWTRYIPLMVEVRRLLAEGAIGEVRMVAADFGYRTRYDPASRAFDPALGGGGLLDVGVYPISLASMIFGNAARIASLAHLGETGVDEQSAFLLGYEEGQLAVLYTAVRTTTPQEADGHRRLHPHPLTLVGAQGHDPAPPRPGTGAHRCAVHRQRLQLRGGRGTPLPARRPVGERRHAAGREPGHHGDHGPHPRPVGDGLPHGAGRRLRTHVELWNGM